MKRKVRKVKMGTWAVKFIPGNYIISDLDCRGGQLFIFLKKEQAERFVKELIGEKNPAFKVIKVKVEEGDKDV